MTEEALTLTNQEISSILATYPDEVADKQEAYRIAEEAVKMVGARLYLNIKACDADGKLKDTQIKNMVCVKDEYQYAKMEAIKAESTYTRVYETLMCAKKMAGLRTAF